MSGGTQILIGMLRAIARDHLVPRLAPARRGQIDQQVHTERYPSGARWTQPRVVSTSGSYGNDPARIPRLPIHRHHRGLREEVEFRGTRPGIRPHGASDDEI